jgi:hypothetical protein
MVDTSPFPTSDSRARAKSSYFSFATYSNMPLKHPQSILSNPPILSQRTNHEEYPLSAIEGGNAWRLERQEGSRRSTAAHQMKKEPPTTCLDRDPSCRDHHSCRSPAVRLRGTRGHGRVDSRALANVG